jgi:hypothetical protein
MLRRSRQGQLQETPAYLAPTRAKLALTAACFALFPVCIALGKIPHTWDILDMRQAGRAVIGLLLVVPIRLFDLVTGSALAPRSEAFVVFPSLPQLAAALVADAALFYLLACTWIHLRARRRATRASTPEIH